MPSETPSVEKLDKSLEQKESWENPAKNVLDKLFLNAIKLTNWFIKPDNADDVDMWDLPLINPTYRDQLTEASHMLTATEDHYHEDVHDVRNQITYEAAKSRYTESLRLMEAERNLATLREELPGLESAYESGEIIEWEMKKAKLAEESMQSELENAPPYLLEYFTYLKDKNKFQKSNAPYNQLKHTKLFWISFAANSLTFLSRKLFNFFPFPHYDKLSDIFAYTAEVPIYGMIMKNWLNRAGDTLNRKLLNKRGKEAFLYKSFTRQDLLSSMTLYGGLWITSEIAQLKKYHPLYWFEPPKTYPLETPQSVQDFVNLNKFTQDPLDVPAYALGLTNQWLASRELIKRFPPDRFQDMEVAVAVRLNNLKQKDQLNPQKLKEKIGTGNESTHLISTYKYILREINKELRQRSMDVRDYSMHKPDQKTAYNQVISTMSRAMARRWLIDQVHQTDYAIRSTFLDKQIDKFTQYREQSRQATVDYRNTLK